MFNYFTVLSQWWWIYEIVNNCTEKVDNHTGSAPWGVYSSGLINYIMTGCYVTFLLVFSSLIPSLLGKNIKQQSEVLNSDPWVGRQAHTIGILPIRTIIVQSSTLEKLGNWTLFDKSYQSGLETDFMTDRRNHSHLNLIMGQSQTKTSFMF